MQVRAVMTLENASKDCPILEASFCLIPSAPDFLIFSEPDKSTKVTFPLY